VELVQILHIYEVPLEVDVLNDMEDGEADEVVLEVMDVTQPTAVMVVIDEPEYVDMDEDEVDIDNVAEVVEYEGDEMGLLVEQDTALNMPMLRIVDEDEDEHLIHIVVMDESE